MGITQKMSTFCVISPEAQYLLNQNTYHFFSRKLLKSKYNIITIHDDKKLETSAASGVLLPDFFFFESLIANF